MAQPVVSVERGRGKPGARPFEQEVILEWKAEPADQSVLAWKAKPVDQTILAWRAL